METIYDWVTVLLFAGLVTLFLHRSVDAQQSGDSIWKYLLASVGCAGANWLGNHGLDLAAVATLAATIAFIIYGLRLIPPR